MSKCRYYAQQGYYSGASGKQEIKHVCLLDGHRMADYRQDLKCPLNCYTVMGERYIQHGCHACGTKYGTGSADNG
jgi:hypothetical protein